MEELKIICQSNLKFVIIAVIAYILDFISGFSRALIEKDIQSAKLKKSIRKGVLYFSFIILGGCAEILFPSEHNFKIQAVCIAIFATDGWSVVENGKDILNIPIVTEFFKNLKGGSDK